MSFIAAPKPPDSSERLAIARRFGAGHGLPIRMAPVAVLISLVLAIGAATPSFLSAYSLRVFAEQSSVMLLLAIGQTIIIIMGGIDLSMAALASLTSVIVALLLPEFGNGAVLCALCVASLIGALQGLVHVKAKIPSFIVTLAGLYLCSGIALAIANTTVPVAENYDVVGWLDAHTWGVPRAFVFGLAVLGLFQAAFARLRFGRHLYAIGMAERVAVLSGVSVWRVKTLAFGASGLCSGLAGVAMVARTSSGSPTIADSLLLPSIAAVLVGGSAITGGHGNLARTFLGVCIVTVMRVGVAIAGVPRHTSRSRTECYRYRRRDHHRSKIHWHREVEMEMTNYPIGPIRDQNLTVLIVDGEQTTYRGYRESGIGQRLLAVFPTAPVPDRAFVDRLEHEYKLADDLDSAWALRPRALIREGARTVLLLEDPGGVPLDSLLRTPLELGTFLPIAAGVAAALGKVHQGGLIHMDLKPANILVYCEDGQPRLTGFGIASRLPRDRHPPGPLETIAGTLEYMAPEQTGRMNRSIDSRSDLYSLGVVLYQALIRKAATTAPERL